MYHIDEGMYHIRGKAEEVFSNVLYDFGGTCDSIVAANIGTK